MRWLTLLGLIAAPALAQEAPVLSADGTVVPPAGCAGLITVQGRSCTVRHVLSCPDQASPFLVYQYRQNGLAQVFALNAEFQTTTRIPTGQGPETLGLNTDPQSISELQARGSDSFDYQMQPAEGAIRHLSGISVLTGEVRTIDGRSLDVVKSNLRISASGEVPQENQNLALLDRDLGVVYTAVTWNAATGPEGFDLTPQEFILPGEPGFLSSVPVIDCGG